VRALTWLPDLSDALGRVQLRLRRLGVILDAAARSELGTAAKPTHVVGHAEINGATREGATASDWPYLAI